jgi:hypothetical protein
MVQKLKVAQLRVVASVNSCRQEWHISHTMRYQYRAKSLYFYDVSPQYPIRVVLDLVEVLMRVYFPIAF